MIVALTTIRSQSEKYPAERLHAVGGIQGQIFLVDGPAFIGGDIAPLKTGGNQLAFRRLGEQISRQLFDGELVEWLVGVKARITQSR